MIGRPNPPPAPKLAVCVAEVVKPNSAEAGARCDPPSHGRLRSVWGRSGLSPGTTNGPVLFMPFSTVRAGVLRIMVFRPLFLSGKKTCGGFTPTAERTVDPARMIVG